MKEKKEWVENYREWKKEKINRKREDSIKISQENESCEIMNERRNDKRMKEKVNWRKTKLWEIN